MNAQQQLWSNRALFAVGCFLVAVVAIGFGLPREAWRRANTWLWSHRFGEVLAATVCFALVGACWWMITHQVAFTDAVARIATAVVGGAP